MTALPPTGLLTAACPCGWTGPLSHLACRAGHGSQGTDRLVCPCCQDDVIYVGRADRAQAGRCKPRLSLARLDALGIGAMRLEQARETHRELRGRLRELTAAQPYVAAGARVVAAKAAPTGAGAGDTRRMAHWLHVWALYLLVMARIVELERKQLAGQVV